MGKEVNVGNVVFGSDALPLIAGPCVIESLDHSLKMAESIRTITEKIDMPLIFKSSFDKANRTSMDSFRGPDMDKGLEILSAVKSEVGIPVLTDVHLPDHPWYIAGQFHPELKSRVSKAHPLFRGFIKAAVKHLNGKS